jgi:hypothetical protein
MKHLRLFEEFDRSGHESQFDKFMLFLSENNFEIYHGREGLENYFFTVAGDDSLSADDKSEKISDYLDSKWGLYDSKYEVLEYLLALFMDEI